MASCPNCHNPVEILDKHLGTLFTCPKCNAVFFVDWNGQPEMAQHEVEPVVEESFMPPPEEPAQASYETPIEPTLMGDIPQDIPEYQAPQEEPYLTPAEEIPPGSEFQSPSQYPTSGEMVSTDFQPPISEFATPPEQAYAETSMPAEIPPAEMPTPEPEIENYNFNEALGQPVPQPMQSFTSDSSDFSDVEAFANTNTSSGPLSYVVVIDGIESSHLLKQLREAMTDSRFGWDVQAITGSMAGGRLILPGLSPAKASVLINRIKYLPFKISWRQDVLSSS